MRDNERVPDQTTCVYSLIDDMHSLLKALGKFPALKAGQQHVRKFSAPSLSTSIAPLKVSPQ